MGEPAWTEEDLEALLRGDREITGRLLTGVVPRLGDEVAALVTKGIQSDQRGRRLVALVNAAIDLCNGSDTALGLPFTKSLVIVLERSWRDLESKEGAIVPSCCAHAVNATTLALFEEGAWNELLGWLPGVNTSFPLIASEPLGHNAAAMAARVLIRTNRLPEARALLASLPKEAHPNAPHVELARRALAQLETSRYEVDRRPSVGEQAQGIWDGTLGDQVRSAEALRESHAKRGLSPARMRMLDHIVAAAREMLELAGEPLPFEKKMSRLAPLMMRWYDELSFFSHPNLDPDHVNNTWIERRIQRISMLVASETPDAALFDAALTDLDKGEAWCTAAGDVQGRWDGLWNGVLLLERRAPEHVAGRLSRLCDEIEESRRLVGERETRSQLAGYFPGLAAKVSRASMVAPNVDLLTKAYELRKGRALLAARADGDSANRLVVAEGRARPSLLGERTHYLGYTVLHHDDRIEAVLYTADGHVESEVIGVRPSEARRCNSQRQLDPRNWTHSMGAAPPRRTLAPLVAPLARAWQSGAIREGDHICVAADDPIHMVPLPYLFLEDDAPVVRFVSMSRCASFSDAKATCTVPVCRPESAAAFFLPAVSTVLDQERQRFDDVVALLGQRAGLHPRVVDRPITAPQFVAELAPRSLIHVDAHGTFPDGGDPYRASGLLVSDGRRLPVRAARNQRLLAPVDLIEAAPDLTGSHVTLNACVSGRGKEGRGGDLLGLEQAFRVCGAASVIASHWDVPADLAATFMKGFYGRWPGGAIGRAEAWRTTIVDMMTSARTPAEAAECCVFSLFGDWR